MSLESPSACRCGGCCCNCCCVVLLPRLAVSPEKLVVEEVRSEYEVQVVKKLAVRVYYGSKARVVQAPLVDVARRAQNEDRHLVQAEPHRSALSS